MNNIIKNAFKALTEVEDIDLEKLSNEPKRVSIAEQLKEGKKPLKEAMSSMKPHFDGRKSFYGKARIDTKDDGTKVLWSYSTPVCRIKDGKATLLRRGYLGWNSSPTTLRHVKEFLQQNGFEIGPMKELAKMYPEEQAGVNEGLNEEWIGPRTLEADSKEMKNLQLACDMFNKLSPNGIQYTVEETYLDFGQDWKWHTIIAHDPEHKIYNFGDDTWQILSPRDWEEIVNSDSEDEVKAAVEDVRKGKYFHDVPKGFEKEPELGGYNLNELEIVEPNWKGNTIYKLDGKFTTNPNFTNKRFDTIDDLKAFLTKRKMVREDIVPGDEKIAFEWLTNELETNKDLWDEENHAYDIEKVNALIEGSELDHKLLHWVFDKLGELDDNSYDYDSFITLVGHYKGDKLHEEASFNLRDEEEVKKAKKILDDSEKGNDVEYVVDVDADSVDELQKSYAGQIILQCSKCYAPRFISVEELVKTDKKDADGNTIYNEGEVCCQCGEKDGFIVAGQVSKFNKEDEDEDISDEQEEEMAPELPEEPVEESLQLNEAKKDDVPETFDEQMDFLAADEQEAIDGYNKIIEKVEDEHVKEQLNKILVEEEAHKAFLEAVKGDHSLVYSHEEHEEEQPEEESNPEPEEITVDELDIDFDEGMFNNLVNNYLKEAYSNVDHFEMTSGTLDGNNIIIEGNIIFTSKKAKPTKFVFESRKEEDKLILEGTNTTFSDSKAFVVEAMLENNTIKCQKLSYNYNVGEQLVEGITNN